MAITNKDIEKLKKIFPTREDLREELKGFATKEDLKRFATKEDLKQFATKEDLKRFATKDDLKQFATKEDLKRFATKLDLEEFAKKEDLDKLRDEMLTGFDKIMKKLEAMSMDLSSLTAQFNRHDNTLNNHEVRITRLEAVPA